MSRISKKAYYIGIAKSVAKRSGCLRRHYGCIIVKNDEIIATGYNGNPRGFENCCDVGRCGRVDCKHNSGDYSDCLSIHAEQNAMLSAARKDMIDSVMYLYGEEREWSEINQSYFDWKVIANCIPCPICARMILNCGIDKVITPGDTFFRTTLEQLGKGVEYDGLNLLGI